SDLNLERMLTGCGCRIGMRGLGLAVECPDAAAGEVRTRLQRALGVQTIVAGRRVEADPAAIAPVALEMIAAQSGASFALNVLRPDKALPLSSYEVAVAVGRYIEERLQLPVDLRQPQRRCTIVLSRKGALVSRAPEPGPGGMPAGTAGRLLPPHPPRRTGHAGALLRVTPARARRQPAGGRRSRASAHPVPAVHPLI